VFAIPDEGETRVLCSFKAPKISYMHSFALTDNYFVLQVRRHHLLLVRSQ
jgi:carotenoid cleavage dioxygenase-like enzyme